MVPEANESRVFVLGAGASIADTDGAFPGIDAIFRKAAELNLLTRERLQLNEQFSSLSKYVQDNFNKDVLQSGIRLNYEDLLTNLDIDLEGNADTALVTAREEALDLIRRTLTDSGIVASADRSGQMREYDLLLQVLHPQDSILTFNWDLLLDERLGRGFLIDESEFRDSNKKSKFKDNQYDNFLHHLSGRSTATWTHVTVNSPYTRYRSSIGYYLKLHGSVDWYCCNSNVCRARSLIFPVADFFNDNYCAECHRRLRPLLIPPTLNKAYNQYPAIQVLWNTATREIEKSAEIVVWGYSLPPTDFYSRWLLRKARNARSISVIDPACLRKTKSKTNSVNYRWNREFLSKFLAVFSTNLKFNARIVLFESFRDYHNGIPITKKYGLSKPV